MVLTFLRARSDITYIVETSDNLAEWILLAINPGKIGEAVSVTDIDLVDAFRRFMRLRVVPSSES